jgi:UDP-N-acetylmuramate dehydrogenase
VKEIRELIKGKVKFGEKMSRHTTFKIGGAIDVWAEPEDTDDLKRLIRFSRIVNKPLCIIGGGSNLLVGEGRIRKIGVRLSGDPFKYIYAKGNRVFAGAGLSITALLNFCIRKGLSGLEFCTYLPGTVGGAIAMNAGPALNGGVGSFVNKITVMDKRGRIKMVGKKQLSFGYRESSVAHYMILGAELRLTRAKKEDIRRRQRTLLLKKKKTQDLKRPSAGCVFKNPYSGRLSAGSLIELAGLKYKRIGGAQVSGKHANYIVNLGKASFNDVKRLIQLIKKSVKKEFNITLEPEIKILT